MRVLAAVDRLNQLEAIGFERVYTEDELGELGALMTDLRELEPTWDASTQQVTHPTIQFWQNVAGAKGVRSDVAFANIKAMHKYVVPHIMYFFTGKYANLTPH